MITFIHSEDGEYNGLYVDGELKMSGDSSYVDIETAGSMAQVLGLDFEWYTLPYDDNQDWGDGYPRYLVDFPTDLNQLEKQEGYNGGGVHHWETAAV